MVKGAAKISRLVRVKRMVGVLREKQRHRKRKAYEKGYDGLVTAVLLPEYLDELMTTMVRRRGDRPLLYQYQQDSTPQVVTKTMQRQVRGGDKKIKRRYRETKDLLQERAFVLSLERSMPRMGRQTRILFREPRVLVKKDALTCAGACLEHGRSLRSRGGRSICISIYCLDRGSSSAGRLSTILRRRHSFEALSSSESKNARVHNFLHDMQEVLHCGFHDANKSLLWAVLRFLGYDVGEENAFRKLFGTSKSLIDSYQMLVVSFVKTVLDAVVVVEDPPPGGAVPASPTGPADPEAPPVGAAGVFGPSFDAAVEREVLEYLEVEAEVVQLILRLGLSYDPVGRQYSLFRSQLPNITRPSPQLVDDLTTVAAYCFNAQTFSLSRFLGVGRSGRRFILGALFGLEQVATTATKDPLLKSQHFKLVTFFRHYAGTEAHRYLNFVLSMCSRGVDCLAAELLEDDRILQYWPSLWGKVQTSFERGVSISPPAFERLMVASNINAAQAAADEAPSPHDVARARSDVVLSSLTTLSFVKRKMKNTGESLPWSLTLGSPAANLDSLVKKKHEDVRSDTARKFQCLLRSGGPAKKDVCLEATKLLSEASWSIMTTEQGHGQTRNSSGSACGTETVLSRGFSTTAKAMLPEDEIKQRGRGAAVEEGKRKARPFVPSAAAKQSKEVMKVELELHDLKKTRARCDAEGLFLAEESAKQKERCKDMTSAQRHAEQKELMSKHRAKFDILPPNEQQRFENMARMERERKAADKQQKLFELEKRHRELVSSLKKNPQQTPAQATRMSSHQLDVEHLEQWLEKQLARPECSRRALAEQHVQKAELQPSRLLPAIAEQFREVQEVSESKPAVQAWITDVARYRQYFMEGVVVRLHSVGLYYLVTYAAKSPGFTCSFVRLTAEEVLLVPPPKPWLEDSFTLTFEAYEKYEELVETGTKLSFSLGGEGFWDQFLEEGAEELQVGHEDCYVYPSARLGAGEVFVSVGDGEPFKNYLASRVADAGARRGRAKAASDGLEPRREPEDDVAVELARVLANKQDPFWRNACVGLEAAALQKQAQELANSGRPSSAAAQRSGSSTAAGTVLDVPPPPAAGGGDSSARAPAAPKRLADVDVELDEVDNLAQSLSGAAREHRLAAGPGAVAPNTEVEKMYPIPKIRGGNWTKVFVKSAVQNKVSYDAYEVTVKKGTAAREWAEKMKVPVSFKPSVSALGTILAALEAADYWRRRHIFFFSKKEEILTEQDVERLCPCPAHLTAIAEKNKDLKRRMFFFPSDVDRDTGLVL